MSPSIFTNVESRIKYFNQELISRLFKIWRMIKYINADECELNFHSSAQQ